MQGSTFVLVHGAWHGGWCWKRVAGILRQSGCDVFTPTLTGLGERAHLLAPSVDLTTHIDDIIGVLDYENLTDVVLVGHSYGGMVISGVAARTPSRIAALVYLDAFLPADGEAVKDFGLGELLAESAATRGDGWRVPSATASDFGITDEEDAVWVNARLGDQPYKTFTQPLDVAAPGNDGIYRSYILATQDLFVPHATRARERGFDSYELFGAGHDVMLTRPAELSALLLEIARRE